MEHEHEHAKLICMKAKKDYQNGKIYTIRSHQTDKYYIGSTTQALSKRFAFHKGNYKRYLNGKYNNVTSFEIINYGDAYIELLEMFPCNSKVELEKREGEMIRQYKNEIVNRIIVGRSKKEWYEDNNEKIKEQQRQYREDNKDKINEKNKQYYEDNIDKIKQLKKQPFQCGCGTTCQSCNKADHFRSKKHTLWLATQQQQI